MCDYSLAAMHRVRQSWKTLVTTRSPASTRALLQKANPVWRSALLPGTELAFEQDVKYDQGWIWTRTTSFRVAKFGVVETNVPHRHHDAIRISRWNNVPGDAAHRRPASDCAAIASCPIRYRAAPQKAR